MAQAANITVNDRAPTPVAHTFTPRDVDKGVATFVEAATVPMGDKTLSIRWRVGENKRYYYRLVLTYPVMVTETVNGVAVPKVVRNALADVNFRFDESCSEQERKDTVGMIANALASTVDVVNSTLVKREGIW